MAIGTHQRPNLTTKLVVNHRWKFAKMRTDGHQLHFCELISLFGIYHPKKKKPLKEKI